MGGFASLTKTYALDNSVLLGLVAFDPTSSTSLNVNSIRLQFERGENETLFITVSVLTTIPPRNNNNGEFKSEENRVVLCKISRK